MIGARHSCHPPQHGRELLYAIKDAVAARDHFSALPHAPFQRINCEPYTRCHVSQRSAYNDTRPQDTDRYTRESFTLRRMKQWQIRCLVNSIAALVVLLIWLT